MNKSFKTLFLLALLVLAVSCNRVKTTQVVEESYADGKPKIRTEYIEDEHGKKTLYKETYFFPEEKKYIEGKYDEQQRRDGVWTSWFENGNKNSQGKYVNGTLHGKYRVWHANGKLFYKGQYDMGRQVGVWEFYDSLGVKTRQESYNALGVRTKVEKF